MSPPAFNVQTTPKKPIMTPTAIIVDDSKISRTVLRRGLLNAGYQVVAEEENGARAIEAYETLRPTLIVLDIVLPGMDGIAAATEILKRHPKAIVIICSSFTARDKILACRAAGVAHFILKPFSLEKITQVVQELASRVASALSERTAA